MAAWYCRINDRVYGPYDNAVLRQMAAEERLLPEDLLRQDENGDWFSAGEMDNLFPRATHSPESVPTEVRHAEERHADEGLHRRRGRTWKPAEKPSNYYEILWHNLQHGGQWLQLLGATAGVQLVLPLLFAFLAMARASVEGEARDDGLSMFLWALGSVAGLAIAFFVDALAFGVPFRVFRVRLDARRDSVLDVLAFCYLIALLPKLAILLFSLGSATAGVLLSLLYPFFHAGTIAYLMVEHWGLPARQSLTFAGIRFGYQMLTLLIYIIIMLLLR